MGVVILYSFKRLKKKVIFLLSLFIFRPNSPMADLPSPSRKNRVHIGMFKQSIKRHIFHFVIKSLSIPHQLQRLITRYRIFKSPNLSNPRRVRGLPREFNHLRLAAVAGGGVGGWETEFVIGGQE